MSALELVNILTAKGVTLSLEGGRIRYEPRSRVSEADLERLRIHKLELVLLLEGKPSPKGPWAELVQHSSAIYQTLEQTGWGALRCVADGVAVVSVYLVSSAKDVQGAALSAGRYYPHTQQLEVYAVMSDVGGARLITLATFTAQAVPKQEKA